MLWMCLVHSFCAGAVTCPQPLQAKKNGMASRVTAAAPGCYKTVHADVVSYTHSTLCTTW